jgi:hypothetical protein
MGSIQSPAWSRFDWIKQMDRNESVDQFFSTGWMATWEHNMMDWLAGEPHGHYMVKHTMWTVYGTHSDHMDAI